MDKSLSFFFQKLTLYRMTHKPCKVVLYMPQSRVVSDSALVNGISKQSVVSARDRED